jgi:hypothetical protein
MMVVMDLLERNESIGFMQIFREAGDGSESTRPTRAVLVATFLAVLELARLAALRIYQGLSDRGTPEGPIRVRRAVVAGDDPRWRERISESM